MDNSLTLFTQVASVTLLSMNQDISFSKDVKCVADVYEIA